jgi:hypothetical protein
MWYTDRKRRTVYTATRIQRTIRIAVGRAVVDTADAMFVVDEGIGSWVFGRLYGVFDL